MEGGRIRKEKVVDLKISGYVWTGPKYVQRDLGTLTKEAIISKPCYILCHVHSRYLSSGFQIHHTIYCGRLDKWYKLTFQFQTNVLFRILTRKSVNLMFASVAV